VNAVISAPSGMAANGHLLAPDFVTFYGASSFLPAGHAATVYDHTAFIARLQALFPHGKPGDYAFLYPPGFLFVCLGLSTLPYMAALVLWLGATLLRCWPPCAGWCRRASGCWPRWPTRRC